MEEKEKEEEKEEEQKEQEEQQEQQEEEQEQEIVQEKEMQATNDNNADDAGGEIEIKIQQEKESAAIAAVKEMEQHIFKKKFDQQQKQMDELRERVQKSEDERNMMIEKITKDSEKMVALMMDLDAARHTCSELEQDAPTTLRRKAQSADRERAMMAVNYKEIIATNAALRREVEALEGLAVRYQQELMEAKMNNSAAAGGRNADDVSKVEEDDNTSGPLLVAPDQNQSGQSRFRKAFVGGSSVSMRSTLDVDTQAGAAGEAAAGGGGGAKEDTNSNISVFTTDSVVDLLLRDHGSLWEDMVIKSRSTLEYPVVIRNAESYLIFFFQLEDFDVGFSLIKRKEREDEEDEILHAPMKVHASDGPRRGMLYQETAGVVTLVFDNKYSIFRSKKFRFGFAVCDKKQLARVTKEHLQSSNQLAAPAPAPAPVAVQAAAPRSRAPSSRSSSACSVDSVSSVDTNISERTLSLENVERIPAVKTKSKRRKKKMVRIE